MSVNNTGFSVILEKFSINAIEIIIFLCFSTKIQR